MTVTSMQDLLDRKNGAPCPLCSVIHKPQVLCDRTALASKITKLMQANSLIPGLLQHNKEATTLASEYRQLLKKADEAHIILMDILAENGEVGELIKIEYMGRLDKWAANVPTNQDTSEQANLFSPEPSTSNETETNSSIRPPSGLILDPGFSK